MPKLVLTINAGLRNPLTDKQTKKPKPKPNQLLSYICISLFYRGLLEELLIILDESDMMDG